MCLLPESAFSSEEQQSAPCLHREHVRRYLYYVRGDTSVDMRRNVLDESILGDIACIGKQKRERICMGEHVHD